MQRKSPFQKPNVFIFYCPDRKVPKVYGSVPFDLEACQQIISKILPWNYPSELSQLIEKEVAKSIAAMDENSCLQGSVNKELDINERKKDLDVKYMNTDYSAAKVKRIKRSLTYCIEDRHKYVESAYDACSKESAYAQKTAIQNGIKPMSGPVPSCCHAGPLEVSLNNEQTPIIFSVCQSFDKLPQNSDPFVNTEIPESYLAKAVVLNFRDWNTKTTTLSNVIDECSHADNISNSKFFDSNPSVPMDMIQKLWRELRLCQKDLGKHANSKQLNVNQVLKLTSGLTDLISEADLFRNHQQEQCVSVC